MNCCYNYRLIHCCCSSEVPAVMPGARGKPSLVLTLWVLCRMFKFGDFSLYCETVPDAVFLSPPELAEYCYTKICKNCNRSQE